MPPFHLAMPGALRLRNVHPLIDGDGTCSLVYDVERAAVVEVPDELRLYVAPALETGDLDEELLGWLASADLLTAESSRDWTGCGRGLADLGAGDPAAACLAGLGARAGAAAGAAAVRWGPDAAGHDGDEAQGWIDQPEAAAALAEVERVFRRGFGSSRIKLHLDWVGTVPAGGLLEEVVMEARRRAAQSGQEVAFEVALAPEQVTAEAARRLAALQLPVRLRCGESDPLARPGAGNEERPWLVAETALAQLRAAQVLPAGPSPAPPGTALTVQCMLDGPARLIDLWRWARALGVQSLDAIRLEDPGAGGGRGCALPSAPLREYRRDLYDVYDETCAELEAGRLPLEFQPLTRIVRRLRRAEAAAALAGSRDEMVMRGDGALFAAVDSLDPRLLPELMWLRLEAPAGPRRPELGELAEPEPPALPCQSCWARQVCSHSAYVASPLAKEDPRDPSRERCAFWAAEVEMALRLHHRLAQIDAMQVLRFLAEPPALQPAPRLRWRQGDVSTAEPS